MNIYVFFDVGKVSLAEQVKGDMLIVGGGYPKKKKKDKKNLDSFECLHVYVLGIQCNIKASNHAFGYQTNDISNHS